MLAAFVAASAAGPASAQVGISASLFSEEWARGDPLSQSDPVARLDLSYDDDSGVYLGGSAAAVLASHARPRLLGVRGYLGIARRTRSGLTLDAGISATHYSEYTSLGRSAGYAEAYVGLANKHFSGRLSYSPAYLQKGRSTIYAELNAVVEPAVKWRLSAHVGALIAVNGAGAIDTYRSGLDWRVGAARRVGRLSLELALTGVGPDSDRPLVAEQSERALILGAVYAF
jgi:uncharacterized protein (TIGR02001 family)